MSIQKSIFFIFIIFANLTKLTKLTKENDKLKKERIYSTLKFIFKQIESYINRNPLSFEYFKYQIKFSNFKICNPLEEDININEIKPNYIYSVKNLTLYFIYNNYIIFDENNEDLKYEDLQKKIEIRFNEIEFFQYNNFLYLNNSSVDSILIPKISGISHLRYFKDYNEGKVLPIFSETNDYCKIYDGLSVVLNNMFQNRILNILEKINLYLFDFYEIMNMSKVISYEDAKIQYITNLDSILITQFEIPENSVYTISNRFYIAGLKLKGQFFLKTGEFLGFNAFLKTNYPLYLDINGIYFTNKYAPFKIEMEDYELQDENYRYEYTFNLKYHYYLEDNSVIYFKNLFN